MTQVIFVNRYFYPDHSATSQMLSDLAFFLAAQRMSVAVVTSRQRYGDASANLSSSETVNGVRVIRVKTTAFGRGNLVGRIVDYASFYCTAFVVLLGIARAGDVIVAKTDPPMVSVVCALAALLRRAALVNWIQDLFPEVASALGLEIGKLPVAILRATRNWSLRQAAANVAIGELMAKRLCSEGVANDRVITIPNWSDGSSVRPIAPNENPMREAWGLGDAFVVGYSGNMGRVHEFETIVDAAERLCSSDRIKFVFIGDGPRRLSVQEDVARRGLKNFIWQPYQEREGLANSLSVADLHFISLRPEMEGLVVPSKYYGIAAAGRPAIFIGDTRGEIGHILSAQHCGGAFEIGDVAGVVDFINLVAADPTLATEMGKNARATFEREFDQSITLTSWASLLRKISQRLDYSSCESKHTNNA